MYLTSLNIKQVGEASGLTCPVLVEWSYGDRLPDVVEIYADDARKVQFDVKNSQQQTSTTVSLAAGTVVRVSVCPRLVENGVLQAQMPNAQGNHQYWESFCLVQSITTKAKPGTGEVSPKPPKSAPTITSLEAIPAYVRLQSFPTPSLIKITGEIRVFWVSVEFDSFLVRWAFNVSGVREIQTDDGGSSGSFRLMDGVLSGLEYEFSVKGRDSGLFGLTPTYSDWSTPKKVVAQKNLTSLRQYLQISGLDASDGIKQYLFADAGSLRSFMQLV
jgi:hypothetical protein